MTLNDLECPIHLKVRVVDGTLDVRLLRVSDSTICIGVARGAERVGCKAFFNCLTGVAFAPGAFTPPVGKIAPRVLQTCPPKILLN